VCHQTVSLVARHLEANGIPTVIIGAARDIVEHAGVPRFLFADFPLGSPCGEPFDDKRQQAIVGMALDLLESAEAPRTTVQVPFKWRAGEKWKDTIFTPEQPFLSDEAVAKWEARKQRYRNQKDTAD
jgi:D-proline reductase (dithiol) PrdB